MKLPLGIATLVAWILLMASGCATVLDADFSHYSFVVGEPPPQGDLPGEPPGDVLVVFGDVVIGEAFGDAPTKNAAIRSGEALSQARFFTEPGDHETDEYVVGLRGHKTAGEVTWIELLDGRDPAKERVLCVLALRFADDQELGFVDVSVARGDWLVEYWLATPLRIHLDHPHEIRLRVDELQQQIDVSVSTPLPDGGLLYSEATVDYASDFDVLTEIRVTSAEGPSGGEYRIERLVVTARH